MTDLATELDTLALAGPIRRGPTCTINDALHQLDSTSREALLRAIDDTAVSAAKLADVLTRHGHPVKAHTVRRHRKRATSDGCACPA